MSETTVHANAFWPDVLASLHEQSLEPRCVEDRDALPYERYRVQFTSLDGVQVTARLSRPAGCRDSLPAIVTAPGYGGWEFGVDLAEAQRGYVVLQLYPRGQGESGPPLDADEPVLRGIEAPARQYHYCGAYCDMVRGVAYLRSRPDVHPERIAAVGTSQGGTLALAAAALDPRLRACVAHVPYLCDMRRNRAFSGHAIQSPARLARFDLFDPIQLAPWIACPTLLSSGGLDSVSPADSVEAVYRRLRSVRCLFHEPQLPHTSSRAFHQMTWEWIARYL